MKPAGRVVTWSGALIVLIALFIHADYGFSWHASAGLATLMTLLALVTVSVSVISIFIDRAVFVGGQFGFASFAFGVALLIVGLFVRLALADLLVLVGTVVMLVGSSLLVAAIWAHDGWRPTTGFMDDSARLSSPMSSTASGAPAGWYPDPGGQATERYWSGSAWTDQVRT